MNFTITGATGHLGRKVTEEILKAIPDGEITVSVRNPEKAKKLFTEELLIKKADYYSEDELFDSFKETDLLIYIPSITHPSIKRITEFENAVRAAERANVKHVIFVGFVADQDYNPFHMSPFFGYAIRRLASSTLEYTHIRNAMYADPLPPYLPELEERGRLLYPAGKGGISFISRRDIAKAIAKIAGHPRLWGRRYTLTGSKAYSMSELATLLSTVSGRQIDYIPMSDVEFAEEYDEPAGFGKVLASLYVAAGQGFMGEVTDDYAEITGENPESLEQFMDRKYNV
ncbi:SDR family oxidoreductase [Bacillus sp. 1P06AnD]|uniref:SDR family oxidoreductase n=1 Tax=Bacillus sp. 1P06AnD TaxID=3132208 RepID=UPI00399F453E